ncbi:hypothetical protein KFK09_025500 [Dendrobium nobile]|uniref:Uncharacterized protein n=1 Tax=Dendrobium nobile TaxID=94219 RepID=A0A8T3AGS1_DENNO|nr:hypothetical protein KFK09_025500 [Dendrobium nobile]
MEGSRPNLTEDPSAAMDCFVQGTLVESFARALLRRCLTSLLRDVSLPVGAVVTTFFYRNQQRELLAVKRSEEGPGRSSSGEDMLPVLVSGFYLPRVGWILERVIRSLLVICETVKPKEMETGMKLRMEYVLKTRIGTNWAGMIDMYHEFLNCKWEGLSGLSIFIGTFPNNWKLEMYVVWELKWKSEEVSGKFCTSSSSSLFDFAPTMTFPSRWSEFHVICSFHMARLAFCKFMVKPSTLLILDEPTNHLDIPSKEMLEEAISEYQGTVITVSHDRYFIRQIVNRVVEVKNNTLQDYAGDYNYYLEKNLEAREREVEREAELDAKAPKVKAKSKMSKEEKEVRKKQKMIAFQQSKSKSKGLKNAKRWK